MLILVGIVEQYLGIPVTSKTCMLFQASHAQRTWPTSTCMAPGEVLELGKSPYVRP